MLVTIKRKKKVYSGAGGGAEMTETDDFSSTKSNIWSMFLEITEAQITAKAGDGSWAILSPEFSSDVTEQWFNMQSTFILHTQTLLLWHQCLQIRNSVLCTFPPHLLTHESTMHINRKETLLWGQQVFICVLLIWPSPVLPGQASFMFLKTFVKSLQLPLHCS